MTTSGIQGSVWVPMVWRAPGKGGGWYMMVEGPDKGGIWQSEDPEEGGC